MDLHDFYYDLPEELIAQDPLSDRSSSRLMVLDKETGEIEHKIFRDIVDYLKPGDCLVVNDTKVIFGPCRLSYTHVFEKYIPEDGGEGKYMTNVLIPKSEKKTIEAIKKAIEAAKKAAIVAKWGGKEPKKLDMALRDGDEKDDEVYEDHYYVNAKSNTNGEYKMITAVYDENGTLLSVKIRQVEFEKDVPREINVDIEVSGNVAVFFWKDEMTPVSEKIVYDDFDKDGLFPIMNYMKKISMN